MTTIRHLFAVSLMLAAIEAIAYAIAMPNPPGWIFMLGGGLFGTGYGLGVWWSDTKRR